MAAGESFASGYASPETAIAAAIEQRERHIRTDFLKQKNPFFPNRNAPA